MNLSAYADRNAAETQQREYGGEILTWSAVRELVEETGVRGHGGHGDHAGHGADAEAGGGGHAHGGDHDAHAAATGDDAADRPTVGVGGRFSTLGEAVAAAGEGDTIRVRGGHYREFPLEIDRSLTLVGEDFPILDGEGSHSILIVRADDVTIEGFELRGAGVSYTRDHSAILVEEAARCRIIGNRLEDNFFGIYLARASQCMVRDNEVRAQATREANSGNGIHLWDVDRIQVEDNRIRGHRDGIYLEFAREVVIRGNRSEENLRYGLHFMFSDESFYVDNVFRRNGAGVAVMYTRDVVMAGNRFEDNWGTSAYGLLLKDVRDAKVEDNVFRNNTIAVHSEGADRISFALNRFERNGWAVRVLGSSQDNHFTMNDFIENTFDVTTNSRRNPNHFDGNYWSAYRGYDLAGDGRGDVPHRPVRLFAYIVERQPVALILLRSFFVDVLEVAERVLPVLTPETLVDARPLMQEVAR